MDGQVSVVQLPDLSGLAHMSDTPYAATSRSSREHAYTQPLSCVCVRANMCHSCFRYGVSAGAKCAHWHTVRPQPTFLIVRACVCACLGEREREKDTVKVREIGRARTRRDIWAC